MNHVERFRAVMGFQSADPLPRREWAMWWDQTGGFIPSVDHQPPPGVSLDQPLPPSARGAHDGEPVQRGVIAPLIPQP